MEKTQIEEIDNQIKELKEIKKKLVELRDEVSREIKNKESIITTGDGEWFTDDRLLIGWSGKYHKTVCSNNLTQCIKDIISKRKTTKEELRKNNPGWK